MSNQQPTKSNETNLKKCIECGQDYESTNRTGHEQKYCSKVCRHRSSYKRREDNLYKKFSGQIQQTTVGNDAEREIKSPTEYINSTDSFKGFGLSNERIFELVSNNAYLSAENKRLEDKITELQKEYQRLEFEFAELEESLDEDESKNSMISGINNIVEKVTPAIPYLYAIFDKVKNKDNAPKV